MFKKVLLVAAIFIASPTIVSAQDLFWSFDSTSAVNTTATQPGTSGTAFIFSAQPFFFDAVDLNFSVSDSSVVLLTGGTAFNDPFPTIGGTAFDSSVVTIDAGGASGNLFSVNVAQNGINPAITPLFNPHFEPGVGPNGAVLLAEVNYDVVGDGSATLDLFFGPQGILSLPDIFINPSFGSATFVGVPEPSTLALLMLGSVGLIGRRKRS